MLSLKEYLFLLFPFIVVFFFIPSQLFYYNSSEWNNDIYLIVRPAIISLIIYMSILLIIYLSKSIHKNIYLQIKNFLPWFFTCLGIFILLSDVLAPVQLSQLDGSNIKSSEPLLISVIEFIILLLSIYLFIKRKQVEKIIYDILILFIIISISYFGFNIYNATNNQNSSTESISKKQNIAYKNKLPNIYMLHLDAMQTDYFLSNVNDNRMQNSFNGFTLFRHNITSYPYTLASVASYLTSTTYKGNGYKRWYENRSEGLLSDLKNLGYDITIIGKKTLLGSSKVDSFITGEQLYQEKTKIEHPMQKQFSSLLWARVLPNFYTNEALSLGAKLSQLFSFDKKKHLQYPTTIAEGIEPYTGVEILKYLNKTEKSRNNFGEFILVQPSLPHGPYVMNYECVYTGVEKVHVASKYMQQVQCATSLVTNFINTLKELNRYDNSLIAIYGDHGSGWAGFLEGEADAYHNNLEGKVLTAYNKEIHPWSKLHLESRSMALLMIKPIKNHRSFKVNSNNTQLLDLYPTITTLLNIKHNNKMEGQDLSPLLTGITGNLKKYDKEQYFYYFKPGIGEKKNIEKIKVVFKNDYPFFQSSQMLHTKLQSILSADELPSKVGMLTARKSRFINDKRKKGFITYGPYVRLNKGNYITKITYKFNPTNKISSYWDIVHSQGKVTLHKQKYTNTDRSIKVDNFKFTLNEKVDNFEIRNFYNGDGILEIYSIEIKKED